MLGSRLKKYNLITIAIASFEFILILCIPLVNLDGSFAQRIGAYILAALFWVCVATEGVFVHMATKERKWMEQKRFRCRALKYSQPGVISFFKNCEASIVDVVLFISAVLVVVLVWTRIKTAWVIMTGISILFLSFNLHCILNGKNYRYLKSYKLYKEEHERDE